MNKINKSELNNLESILSFKDFIGSNKIIGHSMINKQYIPIAESLLESNSFDLSESQVCILEFVKTKRYNPEIWIKLHEENYFEQVKNWFSENFLQAGANVISGAIDWLKKLGSGLVQAVSSVVEKIMDSIKDTWEMVKVETSSWYLGNKSLKRQVTMSINQQFGGVSESLNEEEQGQMNELWAELSKESSQLNTMFFESVKNIIEGEAFASKVTMSINKAVNESSVSDYALNNSLNASISNLLPKAIKEGVIDINSISSKSIKRNIKSFDEIDSVNEVFQYIDQFYKWCMGVLESLPPFSWLKGLTEHLEKNSNEALEYMSKFLTDNFGIPGPYKFEKMGPIFAVIVSALIEYTKYTLIHKVLAFTIFPIPIVGPILSFLMTLYGFFVLTQVIFEVIQNFQGNGEEMQPQLAK